MGRGGRKPIKICMLSSLFSGQSRRRSHALAIDLGQRTTKAVHVQRGGTGYDLVQYALMEAPVFERGLVPEVLGEHLQQVVRAAGYKGKQVGFIIGVQESLLRHAELPLVPVDDMRLMLKYNSKNYLQQDLPDYVFDCHAMAVTATAPEAGKGIQKTRVLVGGAKKQVLDQLQDAAKLAGLVVDQVTPSLACPSNAFEQANPEAFAREIIALVDVGFRSSTISILANGELALSRVLSIGADRLTAGLAEAMGVSYAEAEGIKVGLPEEVQSLMQGLITPLGRELRASIDFFEHQQDKTVGHVYVSGGSARSRFLVDSLQSELMVPTSVWSPVAFMNLSLPPEKLGEVEQVASQLAVAVGGAMAAF